MGTELFRYTIYSVSLIIKLNIIILPAQSRDFFCSLKRPAVSGAHPASYLAGVKLKTAPFSTEVKNEWSSGSISSCAFIAYT